MIDPLSAVKELQRPTLLVTAARFGLPNYKREKAIRRILGTAVIPGRKQCVLRLMEMELELETARRAKDPAYVPARHVKILTALMHEAQRPRGGGVKRQENASATSDFLRAI